MSIEQFEVIISQIKSHTKAVTLHVMGEPLAHPQLSFFLNSLEKHNVPLILTSNGHLIHKQASILLSSTIIKQLNFSVHSFFDNFPNKDIKSYLKKLNEFSKEFLRLHPQSFINYRMWNLPIIKTQQINPNQIALSELKLNFPNAEEPNLIDVRKQKSYRLDRHLKLHFDTQFEWPNLNSNTMSHHGFCYGLKSQIAILTDGTIVPCCLDKEGVINLGSIYEQSFESIINSQKALSIINHFKQNIAIEPLCQKCQFKTRFKKNNLEEELKTN